MFLRRLPIVAALSFFTSMPSPAELSVDGAVLDTSGAAFAGADLRLLPILANYEAGRLRLAGGEEPEPVAVAESDEAGRFRLSAPAPGIYKIRAAASGHVAREQHPVVVLADTRLRPVVLHEARTVRVRTLDQVSDLPLSGARVFVGAPPGALADPWRPAPRFGATDSRGEIAVPMESDEAVEITAFFPGTIGSTVRAEALGDPTVLRLEPGATRTLEVHGPGGEPLPDVLVRVGGLLWPVGSTDSKGRIVVPADRHEPVRALLLAPDGGYLITAVPAAGEEDRNTLVLDLPRPRTLAGRVVDADGGVPSAPVLVWSALDPGAFRRADREGRYRLTAPPFSEHRFWVQAEAAGYVPRSTGVDGMRPAAPPVVRVPSLALTRSVALAGKVMDTEGEPVSHARLEARPVDRRPFFRIDPVAGRGDAGLEGRFSLPGLQGGTRYELSVEGPGFAPRRLVVRLPERADSTLDTIVVLTRSRPAFGRVVDVEERPVVGAEVSLRDAAAPPALRPDADDSFRTTTDADGCFRVAAVPADKLDLRVYRTGDPELVIRGVEAPDGTGPIDFGTVVLPPGTRLDGRVIDVEGAPIAGASVLLLRTRLRREALDEARLRRLEPQATADARGFFTIDELVPGEPVSLFIHHSGHSPSWQRSVAVPAPERFTVVLEKALSVTGRVLDEYGEFIAGAEIGLEFSPTISTLKGPRRVGSPTRSSAVSGADGTFTLTDLRPGSLATVEVTARGFVTAELRNLELPEDGIPEDLVFRLRRGAVLEGRVANTAGESVAGARLVAASASAFSDAEGVYRLEGVAPGSIQLVASHPDYAKVENTLEVELGTQAFDVTFPSGQPVSGRVVDSADLPVAGAEVLLVEEAYGIPLSYRTQSGNDGSFRLPSVADGRFRATAAKDGHAADDRGQELVVAGREVEDLEIRLEAGKTVAGRVVGLEFAELARLRLWAKNAREVRRAGRLDHEGGYEIVDLGSGDWLVEAELDGGRRHAQARVHLGPEDSETRRDLEFDDLLDLTGEVVSEGAPLPDTLVSLDGLDLALQRLVITDHEGGFEIGDLEPGSYRLGLSNSTRRVIHNEIVRLTGDAHRIFDVTPSSVSGIVVDARRRRPIASALVLLYHLTEREGDSEFLVSAGSDADGFFELPRVPAGRYRLDVRRDGYGQIDEILEVHPGADVRGLEVAVPATQGLELQVLLASGAVPVHVDVEVVDGSGRALIRESRSADTDGRVWLATVPAGTWDVRVAAAGAALTAVRATAPGEPVTVVLPEAGRLAVRIPELVTSDLVATLEIRDGAGQPLRNMGPMGRVQQRWQVAGGQVTVGGVPAGVWSVEVTAPDGRRWQKFVATSATDAEIHLDE